MEEAARVETLKKVRDGDARASERKLTSSRTRQIGPIQVQGCDPQSQVPLGKSTHIEIRDVGDTFSMSFNGEVQCTTDCAGHVLPARF